MAYADASVPLRRLRVARRLLPLERAVPLDHIVDTDLRSLDGAFPQLPALSDGTSATEGR